MSDPRYYYKGSRLKKLRAFCLIARLGSVSRAAEALFLSQPAVSLQLGALEKELGERLFERNGRRLNLTGAGQVLYELARPLVEGMDGLEGEFRARLRGLAGGQLDIAAGASTIQYLLPPLVQAFRDARPDVQLALHNVTGKDGLALVRSDAVDLAVGSMLDVPNDIDYAPVYQFDPMLIVPPGHPLATKEPLTLADIGSHGLILPPKRLTTWRLVDLVFQRHKLPYTVALEVGGWDVIKQYVAMGLGISIVTGFCLTEADRERLVARNVREWFPPRSYGVVIRKGKYLGPAAQSFANLVRPDLFTRGDGRSGGHSER